VTVATDNQAVLDASDSVVLGLTPQDAAHALTGLSFAGGAEGSSGYLLPRKVVSLMHGVSPQAVAELLQVRAGRAHEKPQCRLALCMITAYTG
jgi:hypothetical protein